VSVPSESSRRLTKWAANSIYRKRELEEDTEKGRVDTEEQRRKHRHLLPGDPRSSSQEHTQEASAHNAGYTARPDLLQVWMQAHGQIPLLLNPHPETPDRLPYLSSHHMRSDSTTGYEKQMTQQAGNRGHSAHPAWAFAPNCRGYVSKCDADMDVSALNQHPQPISYSDCWSTTANDQPGAYRQNLLLPPTSGPLTQDSRLSQPVASAQMQSIPPPTSKPSHSGYSALPTFLWDEWKCINFNIPSPSEPGAGTAYQDLPSQ